SAERREHGLGTRLLGAGCLARILVRRLVRGPARQRRSEVGAEALHRFAHVLTHAVGDEPHRVGEAVLDPIDLIRARTYLGAAGVGDRVDRGASVASLRDEPLFLELREARIDRAGTLRVRPTRA